eukprot:5619127-Pyramimonas_sp.AAC.1
MSCKRPTNSSCASSGRAAQSLGFHWSAPMPIALGEAWHAAKTCGARSSDSSGTWARASCRKTCHQLCVEGCPWPP